MLKSIRSLKVLNCPWPVAEALLSIDDDEALIIELEKQKVEVGPTIEAACDAEIIITKERLKELNDFFQSWTWGPAAANFFFGYYTDSFVNPGDELSITSKREVTHTKLFAESKGRVINLPKISQKGLAGIASRRRSHRKFLDNPVDLDSISGCLSVAFGFTGELKLKTGQKLPLTGAPSPGGLNTYDAFLLSRNVKDLKSGTYRYLPGQNALDRVKGSLVSFGRLFGNQAWCAGAAFAIVFIADLNRQSSRYVFPTTLSAVLIEAGARAELVLLKAEEESLAATLVGLNGVGSFDQKLAQNAGLPSETSMKIPICAILFGNKL